MGVSSNGNVQYGPQYNCQPAICPTWQDQMPMHVKRHSHEKIFQVFHFLFKILSCFCYSVIWKPHMCRSMHSPSLYLFRACDQRVDQKLFEGDEKRRIPKKDWGLSSLFEIAGMIIASSVLSGGPGFPCLLPAIFYSLLTGIVNDECIPV